MAGYVVQKLYSRFKFSKSDAQYKKRCMEILSASKIDSDDTQIYVDTKNRGGLFKTNMYTQNIFMQFFVNKASLLKHLLPAKLWLMKC